MTNGDYVKQNITADSVTKVIIKLMECTDSYCESCPAQEDCNNIQEKLLEQIPEELIGCGDIINHWWNSGIDTIYYSHYPSHSIYRQRAPNRSRDGTRKCALCGKNAAQVPMARICMDASSGPKKFADLCEECYPKFCAFLGVDENTRFSPNFKITKMLSKKTKKADSRTICGFCGTKCSPKHHFCHECGNELDN